MVYSGGAVITVVVPVSPIPSMPSTEILDETIGSIRHWHPDAEIMLCFDGVRAEQEYMRADYDEFIRRALWNADHDRKAVCPFIFETHHHQVGMLRAVMDEIKTDLLLFVEQDAPLVTDEPIDWDASVEMITSGRADIIRYAHEAVVPQEHSHMMLGIEGQFMRTCQFSARPHLASVAYYRRILASHFSPKACSFIEDVMHSVCHQAYILDGINGWRQHRLWYFHPEGGNIKRSYTTDGRAGGPKYDDKQVF